MQDPFDHLEDKKKRKRKTKEEVERGFVCVIKDCGKAYGWAH